VKKKLKKGRRKDNWWETRGNKAEQALLIGLGVKIEFGYNPIIIFYHMRAYALLLLKTYQNNY